MPNHDDLKILFAHSVPSEAQLAQYHEISTPALILAQTIVKHCAASAATDLCLHMLYTAVQIAKAQISVDEERIERTYPSPDILAPVDAPGALTPEGEASLQAQE